MRHNRKNKNNIVTGMSMILVLVITILLASSIIAQTHKVDLETLTKETQKMDQSTDNMTFAWWIPEEYWRASFELEPTMTQSQIEEFVSLMKPYLLLVALDGNMGAYGDVNYKSKETLRNQIKVTDNNGNIYYPLKDGQINTETKSVLAMMTPVFKNILGPMGENMHFFLFPAEDRNGQMIADAKSNGSFTVTMGNSELTWELPLSSLLEPKKCPVDNKEMNGAWRYCPFHGVKLK